MTNPDAVRRGLVFRTARPERSPLACQVVGAFSPLPLPRRTTEIRAPDD